MLCPHSWCGGLFKKRMRWVDVSRELLSHEEGEEGESSALLDVRVYGLVHTHKTFYEKSVPPKHILSPFSVFKDDVGLLNQSELKHWALIHTNSFF